MTQQLNTINQAVITYVVDVNNAMCQMASKEDGVHHPGMIHENVTLNSDLKKDCLLSLSHLVGLVVMLESLYGIEPGKLDLDKWVTIQDVINNVKETTTT